MPGIRQDKWTMCYVQQSSAFHLNSSQRLSTIPLLESLYIRGLLKQGTLVSSSSTFRSA